MDLLDQSIRRAKLCKQSTFPQQQRAAPISVPIATPPPEGLEMRLLMLTERVAQLEFLNTVPEDQVAPILRPANAENAEDHHGRCVPLRAHRR